MLGKAFPVKPPAEHGSALQTFALMAAGPGPCRSGAYWLHALSHRCSAEPCSAGALPVGPIAEHGSALQTFALMAAGPGPCTSGACWLHALSHRCSAEPCSASGIPGKAPCRAWLGTTGALSCSSSAATAGAGPCRACGRHAAPTTGPGPYAQCPGPPTAAARHRPSARAPCTAIVRRPIRP